MQTLNKCEKIILQSIHMGELKKTSAFAEAIQSNKDMALEFYIQSCH